MLYVQSHEVILKTKKVRFYAGFWHLAYASNPVASTFCSAKTLINTAFFNLAKKNEVTNAVIRAVTLERGKFNTGHIKHIDLLQKFCGISMCFIFYKNRKKRGYLSASPSI